MARLRLERLLDPYRVTYGKEFQLRGIAPDDTGPFGRSDEESARELSHEQSERICALQERLYAQDRQALLVIFQAMDAAGKDGTIKHVMSGVNPQGCQVTSFKVPSGEELDHDFLWRTTKALPERGRIGIFNRSYYEEVLVVRVHPEFLVRQKLPDDGAGKKIWKHRYESINAHELHLVRSGVNVVKFFLHVSKKEQKRRFLDRLNDPDKYWKFSAGDIEERKRWDEYMEAYEDMVGATATEHAPWFVVPADHKWFTRLVVSSAIVETLEAMDLTRPKLDAARREEIAACKRMLENGTASP